MAPHFDCGEFECRRIRDPELQSAIHRPADCPACPVCPGEQSGGTTVTRPTNQIKPKPKTFEMEPKDVLFNPIGLDDRLGETTFEDESKDLGCLGPPLEIEMTLDEWPLDGW